MQTRALCVVLGVLVALGLAGCGGGGGGGKPDKPDVGTIVGRIIVTAGSPTDYRLELDGQPIGIRPKADGSFVIPNVPAGDHEVAAIGPDGMTGGRAYCTVPPGGEVEIPPIETELGGQIVGMVMKIEDGVMSPLVGVEVVARSDLYWIETPAGGKTVRAVGEDQPLIYPPPDGESYSAITDERGSYLMPAVRPGGYLVTVAVPGLVTGSAWVWVEAGSTAVADFKLVPDVEIGVGTIQGTVRGVGGTEDSAAPLEGALVEVTPSVPWMPPLPTDPVPLPDDPDGGIAMPPIEWRTFSTLTDSAGHYSLNVPAGPCDVVVTAYGYEGQWQSVTVRKDEVLTVDFLLTPMLPPPDPVPVGR